MTDTPFTSWLRKYIDESGVTVTDIAIRFGVAPCTIYSWLRRHREPNYSILRQIARIAEIDGSTWFREEVTTQ